MPCGLRALQATLSPRAADRDYFAFLKATDGLLHIRGLLLMLRYLDEILRELSQWCGEETEIILFSDHGMNLQENRRAPLQTHLRRAGFQTTNKLARTGVRQSADGDGQIKTASRFRPSGCAAMRRFTARMKTRRAMSPMRSLISKELTFVFTATVMRR
jgi:hypothetical protein